VLAGSDLGEQFGLDLPGLLHGGPALTGDPGGLNQRMRPVGGSRPAYTWTCRPSRSGRCRITTDPPSCRSDSERMTAEQARQPA
jgi:hypothetical protein